MDFSYNVDLELDYQEAESLGLSLQEYYEFIYELANNKVSSIDEWRKNYGSSN